MQAAAGKEENPFLADDDGPEMQQQHQQPMHHTPQHQQQMQQHAQQQQFAGDGLVKPQKPARPPARPPPPQANASVASVTSSPAKSAFDDLNDTIQFAMGGSPSRKPPLVPAAPSVLTGGPKQTGFYGSSTPHQQAFAQQDLFSSPANNPVMGVGGVCPNENFYQFVFSVFTFFGFFSFIFLN